VSDPAVEDLVAGLPPLVSIAEAAKHVRQSPRTIRSWIAQGRSAVVKTTASGSGRVLIPRVELGRFLLSRVQLGVQLNEPGCGCRAAASV
jgi:excisionase family DNA binding protein